jgi:hypothetical protein
MNESAVQWLNSPDSDEWRRDNFDQLMELVTVKEPLHHYSRSAGTNNVCGYVFRVFLWHA